MPIRPTPITEPEPTPALSLLDKFEAISVDKTLKIAPADKAHCEALQKEYDARRADLEWWYLQLSNLATDKNGITEHPYFKTTTNQYGPTKGKVREVSKNWEYKRERMEDTAEKNMLQLSIFTPAYSLCYISKMLRDLMGTFGNMIVEYFNTTYGIKHNHRYDFTRSYYEEDENATGITHYTEVVERILQNIGGLDLSQVGHELLKNDLRTHIRYQSRITATTNKLILKECIYYKEWRSMPGQEWGDSGIKTIDLLGRAFSYYETGELVNVCNALNTRASGEKVDFEAIEFLNFSKIRSIKFFKNRKIDIEFWEHGEPQKFLQFFETYKMDA